MLNEIEEEISKKLADSLDIPFLDEDEEKALIKIILDVLVAKIPGLL